MMMERSPHTYTRIETYHDTDTDAARAPASAAAPPRTLRHKVSRVLTTLTRREPSERERGPSSPLPTPNLCTPLSPTTPSTAAEHPQARERPSGNQNQKENPLKRTWGRSVAMARTRSEPALRAKRAKAAAAALMPAVPSRSATTATHSRDVNAYVPAREGAVVSYMHPMWRIDPVLVGCFVCL